MSSHSVSYMEDEDEYIHTSEGDQEEVCNTDREREDDSYPGVYEVVFSCDIDGISRTINLVLPCASMPACHHRH